jgi:hypothetical protein
VTQKVNNKDAGPYRWWFTVPAIAFISNSRTLNEQNNKKIKLITFQFGTQLKRIVSY